MNLSHRARGPEPAHQDDSTPKTASAHPITGRCASRSEPDALRWRRINDEHRASESAGRVSVEHAIRCGEMLLEEKARAGHGRWLLWVADNFRDSVDKAQRHMRLANHKEMIVDPNTAGLRYSSVDAAIAALSSPKDSGQAAAPSGASEPARPSPPVGTPAVVRSVEVVPEGSGERAPTRPVPQTAVVVDDLPPDRDAPARTVPAPQAQAQAKTFDVAAGDEDSLAAATAYIEAAARADWRAGRVAHLLVYCSPDPEGRASLVEALPFSPEVEDDPFTEDWGHDKVSAKERKQKRNEERRLRAWKKAERSRMYAIIRAEGKIKPTRDLKEEYREVSSSLKRQDGRPGDVMASLLATEHPEFGVRDEASLIDVLSRRL
ncbi:MAG: hypothetical protein M3P49_11070 [Actinomycetota bacterium]|nr:hypothetical protein [Actinomycetota bacterium]